MVVGVVDLSRSFLACFILGYVLEGLDVFTTELEDRIIIRSHTVRIVRMNERPVLKVKLVAEDVTLEQICDLDALFNQCDEIVLEQKEEDVRVLVLLNVLDNHVCRANLVAFERDIKGCRDFDARIIVLLVLYLVKERVLRITLGDFFRIREQLVDAPAIE